MTVTILVCGGRDYPDRDHLFQQLDWCRDRYGVIEVIEGGARGADRWAREWRAERGAPGRTYPADWATHPRAAGPIRNRQMLVDGKPDLVLAFPGGRGTLNMVRQARSAHVPVIEFSR